MIDAHTLLKLDSAIVDYDKRQSRTKSYNRYALGHYCRAMQEVKADVSGGIPLDHALCRNFNGRLRDKLLKAAGFDPKGYPHYGRGF